MISSKKTPRKFVDDRVNVKIKLSALWITLVLIYLYVDIFSFYKPGIIEGIMAGRVWTFEISQTWALGALFLMMIPIVMVLLSVVLKAGVNRWINIIVAILYIVVGIGTTVGENWIFYIVGHIAGIVLLLTIIWTAWKWPKLKA